MVRIQLRFRTFHSIHIMLTDRLCIIADNFVVGDNVLGVYVP